MIGDSDTLAQSVAAALRQAIQDGVYTCGDRLVELAISQEMTVSQNTARDALYILEREGWAVKQARRGTHVRAFTRSEADEVYALWAAVSELALGWALDNVPRAMITQHLQPVISNTRTLATTGNTHGALTALFHFHRILGSAIDHSRSQTAELLMRLRNQAHLLEIAREHRAPRSNTEWEAYIVAYETLLGVIKFGSGHEAQEAIRQRIEADGKALLAASY
jgi:DNA-binding GntR family transcriptional regulator